jgi:ubiquinol-cytochrome c reductase iron-sulfur subunit
MVANPFIKALAPAQDTLRNREPIEVDLLTIREGEMKEVLWGGERIIIVHREPDWIEKVRGKEMEGRLKDPIQDEERVIRPDWFISSGVCTHLGCSPTLVTREMADVPFFPALFCGCHGGIYDVSGRIFSGPPPANLYLIPYKFIDEETVLIGKTESPPGFMTKIQRIQDLPKI